MDRRQFLRRAVGGSVVVAASVQSGWTLKTLRGLLARLFREQAPAITYMRVSDLAKIWKRTNTKMMRALHHHVAEYASLGMCDDDIIVFANA